MLLLAVSLTGLGPRAAAQLPLANPEGPESAAIELTALEGRREAWKGENLRSTWESLRALKGSLSCIQTMECNSTVFGTLEVTDCDLADGTLVDFWFFGGTAGDEVTINLISNDFDTVLGLLDPASDQVAQNDNGGAGTNSRIIHTLNASGSWGIAVNNAVPVSGNPGDYLLSLDCAGTAPPPPPPDECVADATTMCLNEGRFQVEVDWRDFNSNTGQAQVVPFGSDDSGLFFFFSADNWEMLVKVLNGCGITDHYWVFAAATTNVEYTLKVTDTERGVVKQFFNPLGVASPSITDTSAFATCP